MVSIGLQVILIVFAICSFGGKDLQRHESRCKSRLGSRNSDILQTSGHLPVEKRTIVENCAEITCCCGKNCKEVKGPKMHQRSCRVFNGLDDNLSDMVRDDILDRSKDEEIVAENETLRNQTVILQESEETVLLKHGVKLPKSSTDWSLINGHFKTAPLNYPIKTEDLNSNIESMNNVIFKYLSMAYGEVDKGGDIILQNRYDKYTVKDLKRELKKLNLNGGDIREIKFVSPKLHSLLSNKPKVKCHNHDNYIKKNFWRHVKNNITNEPSVLPSFNKADCLSLFKKCFSVKSPNNSFSIPSWIPSLATPQVPFNLDPPSYQQVTRTIRSMKASASPCRLDQASIISFKCCPFLWSYLTQLISAVWPSGTVPSAWKKACTVLVHKKGVTSDPSNFRPITLESVPLKIFTSSLRNAIFKFLTQNSFIEHAIQKGFSPKLSGTLEHTAQMVEVINQARLKQRS